MRIHIILPVFFIIAGMSGVSQAATLGDMENQCKTIARAMMEDPATFKFISAKPASRDGNTGVAIHYSGSKKGFNATLSCFFVKDEISRLHLEATLENGDKVNDYLADILVEQAKKNLRSSQ